MSRGFTAEDAENVETEGEGERRLTTEYTEVTEEERTEGSSTVGVSVSYSPMGGSASRETRALPARFRSRNLGARFG